MTSTKTTAAQAADISERAVLVNMNVSCWNGRRFDRKVTDETNESHGASKEAGRYNKHLFGGKGHAKSHADAIAKGGALRALLYKETLPWTDEGFRLLPSANIAEFSEKIRKARAEFDAAVDAFIAEYPALKAKAQELLNGMYREEDYPTAEELRAKFSFEIGFAPVPRADDFRVSLPEEHLDEIQRSAAERIERANKLAVTDAWARMHEVVERVRERLTGKQTEGKGKGKDKVFRDSLIGNIEELTDVLKRLNVTDDPDIEAMRARVERELASLEPKKLREDSKVRAKAKKTAEEILDQMKGFYGGAQ